jgi:hypothetical protein
MSRRLAVLLGADWRARLPKKPASNSADTAHGKRREGLQIKLSVDLCPKPSFEPYKRLENYAAGV